MSADLTPATLRTKALHEPTPFAVRDTDSMDLARRRLTVGAAFTIAGLALPFVPLFWWAGAPWTGAMAALVSVLALCTPIWMRRTGSQAAATVWLLCSLLFAFFVLALLARGEGPALWTFALIPLYSSTLGTQRQTLAMSVVTVALVGLIHPLLGLDLPLPHENPPLPLWISEGMIPMSMVFGIAIPAYFNRRLIDQTWAQVQNSRAELQAVLDSTVEGIVALDFDGRVTVANEAALGLFGRSSTAFIGLGVRELMPGLRLEGIQAKEVQPVELHRPAQDLVHAEVTLGRVAGSERERWVLTIRDAGARHETLQALALARVAADANLRAKDAFLAALSHELRTPLNAIIGYSDLLASESGPGPQATTIAEINAAGHHLLGLVDTVLLITLVEAGQLTVSRATVEVETLGRSCIDRWRAVSKVSGHQLLLELEAGLPTIQSDPVHLERILTDLIGNAMKFSPGGPVTLRITRAEGPGVEALQFDVMDQGIGIEAHQQETIFEYFHQADTGWSRGYDGIGLGLPVCRKLALLLGGSLGVESTPGVGSCFTLQIPVGAPEGAAQG